MNNNSNMKRTKPINSIKKRTPRTVVLDDNLGKNKPALISEAFNLKNFDIVGKVDDMRVLTKELSIMARQLEQWVAVIHTIGMAFKDSGVLREVIKNISSININENSTQKNTPSPFPFFQNNNDSKENISKNHSSQSSNNGINFAEVLNNPVFKEIINTLFNQNKK
ncbi:MAG: hypothetical protein AB7V16_05090 [Vulcanibacillus sp.]